MAEREILAEVGEQEIHVELEGAPAQAEGYGPWQAQQRQMGNCILIRGSAAQALKEELCFKLKGALL